MTRGFVKLSYLALGFVFVFGVFAIASAILVSNQTQKQDIRSKAAPATTLSMDQNSLQVAPNGNFTLNAVLNPGVNLVTATEIHIKFDPSKIELLNVNPNLSAFQEVLGQGQTIEERIKIDNTLGTIYFTLGASTLNPVNNTVNIASLNFKAKNTVSSSTVEFDTNSVATALNELTPTIINGVSVDVPANVLVSKTGAQVNIINPTSTPTSTPIPTLSPTPTITLCPPPSLTLSPTPTPTGIDYITTLNIKLNSLSVNNLNIPVNFQVKNTNGDLLFQGTTVFTSNANAIFSGTFHELPVGNSIVWLKPANFLAKKYDLNLQENTSINDFTAPKFISGDLDTGGNSYNKIDIFDFGMLVAHFGDLMPASGSLADLDKNNKVDIYDFGLLVQGFNQTGASK